MARTRLAPPKMDARAVLAAFGILALAPVLAYLVTSSPIFAAGAMGALASGLVLLSRIQWIAPILTFGFMFNGVYASVGFAFLGVGDAIALMAFGAWLIHKLGRSGSFNLKGLVLLLLFTLICYVSLVNGVRPGIGRGPFVRQLVYMLGLIVMMDTLRSHLQLRWVMYALSYGSILHCLYVIATYNGAERVGGVVDQPNALAHLVAVGMLPTLERLQQSRDTVKRALWAGAILLQVAVLVMSLSRGTILALGIALLWWVRHNRGQVLLLLTVSLGVFISLQALEDKPTHDMVQARLALEDPSLHHRTEIFGYGLEALTTHPWLGVGFGQFTELDRAIDLSQNASGRASHNYYLNVAVSVGLPGLLLLLSFWTLHARRIWRRHRQLSQRKGPMTPARREAMLLLSLTQCILLFEAAGLLTKGDMMGLLWLLMGLAAGVSQIPPLPLESTDERTPDPC